MILSFPLFVLIDAIKEVAGIDKRTILKYRKFMLESGYVKTENHRVFFYGPMSGFETFSYDPTLDDFSEKKPE